MPKDRTKHRTLRETLAGMRQRIAASEEGATAIEYALIASGIGAAVASTVYSLGSKTNALYTNLYTLLH